jgi:hypothetical protein
MFINPPFGQVRAPARTAIQHLSANANHAMAQGAELRHFSGLLALFSLLNAKTA